MQDDVDFYLSLHERKIPQGPIRVNTRNTEPEENDNRPVVGTPEIDEDGNRVTVITRIDGSQFRVTVPKGAMRRQERFRSSITIEELE